jgi:hypothetical protein
VNSPLTQVCQFAANAIVRRKARAGRHCVTLKETLGNRVMNRILDQIKAAQRDHLNDDLQFIFIYIKGSSRVRRCEEN